MDQQDGYDGGSTTGFVSPAADGLEGPLDLAGILDLRRPHRYPVRVQGDALRGHGIHCGDVLIADAALPPAPGRIAIVQIFGETVVARLARRDGDWWLLPGGRGARALRVPEEQAELWAIVCALVRTKL